MLFRKIHKSITDEKGIFDARFYKTVCGSPDPPSNIIVYSCSEVMYLDVGW
jgi:hypothetical protein